MCSSLVATVTVIDIREQGESDEKNQPTQRYQFGIQSGKECSIQGGKCGLASGWNSGVAVDVIAGVVAVWRGG